MIWWEALLLAGGGLCAGVFNTMAGGGSALTVPLLVIAGVPGNIANGSNRIGVLTSNIAAVGSFRRLGVRGIGQAWQYMTPIAAGSLVGAYAVDRLTDDAFEMLFGFIVVPVALAAAWPRVGSGPPDAGIRRVWGDRVSPGSDWGAPAATAVFFVIGIYGGAVQAGLGLLLLAALNRSGLDLVLANHVKAVANVTITAMAVPVFIASGNVRWVPAMVLAAGFTVGGWLGAGVVVKGGDRWIRVAMVVAAFVLATRLLGVFG